jgi:hypothetical protein
MNALQVVQTTPPAITRQEAAFHSSAEKYRERANLIRDSIGETIRTVERTRLLDVAAELERLAAELEQMRINKRGFSVFRRYRRPRPFRCPMVLLTHATGGAIWAGFSYARRSIVAV